MPCVCCCRSTPCNISCHHTRRPSCLHDQSPSHAHQFIEVTEDALQCAGLQNLLYQLCKGLAHCHRHGVMHRDLKPQNLLVDDAATVLKIADLGLGRSFSIPVKSYTHEVCVLAPGGLFKNASCVHVCQDCIVCGCVDIHACCDVSTSLHPLDWVANLACHAQVQQAS